MAQALGGIAEAYSTPGQPLRTGIVSVADETCAILAFGGALAALTHARATGIGQKVDCSLLGGQIRLMGWTLTTTMWRNRNPVTGQARITGTRSGPASAPASTTATASRWCSSSTARAVEERDDRARLLRGAGTGGLRRSRRRDRHRPTSATALLRMLDELFATGPRDDWVERLRAADIVSAPINTLLEASNDPDVLANGYVTEIDYPKHGKRLKVHGSPWHFSETPAQDRHRPGARRRQRRGARGARLHAGADRGFAGTKDHLTRPAPHPNPPRGRGRC